MSKIISRKTLRSFHSHLDDNIKSHRIDSVLLLIGLASSIVDTLTITILKVSVAHNTLNILILAMGTVGVQIEYPLLIRPTRALVCLLSSWFGSFLSGRIGRYMGVKRRGSLFYNFAFQAVVVYLAAILLYTNVISLTNNTNHILLAILSFAFGIQFASTKLLHPLGCSAIPGQVITGCMVDLFTDPNLFLGFNAIGTRNRNCRIVFFFTFFTGGAIGGLLSTYQINAGIILFLVATLKFIASLVLLILSKEALLPIASPIIEVKEKAESVGSLEDKITFELDSAKGSILSFSKGDVIVTTEIV